VRLAIPPHWLTDTLLIGFGVLVQLGLAFALSRTAALQRGAVRAQSAVPA
jgi:hypothetical protein